MRFFVRFAYCGTAFHGSQSQPGGGTVQDTMEAAFALLLRQPIALVLAGRTDAGVHAEMMWAHFTIEPEAAGGQGAWDLSSSEGLANLRFRLNRVLPESIAIYEICPVTEDAHARFDAMARTYHYRITTQKNPFLYGSRTRVREGLDFERMNEAAALLLGKQDFSSFCRTHTDVKTKLCHITRAEWIRENAHEATFVITADRFLRNMVRAVVGTLFEVGRGQLSVEDFAQVIAQQDRQSAGESAEAKGLYLVEIIYPSTIFTPITPNNTRVFE